MPTRLVDNPQHWRDRATDMRALLDAITDLDIRSKVLRLADDYDTLAERTEDRAGGPKKLQSEIKLPTGRSPPH